MLEVLRQIRFARFQVEMVAAQPLKMPSYQGSALRGAFGTTFKQVVCVMPHRNCGICLLRQQCVYAVDFETPLGDGSYAPHPFVIEPPLETKTDYSPGDSLAFGLVLIGRAIDHLPYFIYALERMGDRGLGRGRGRCTLEAVWHTRPDGARQQVYDGKIKQMATADWHTHSVAEAAGQTESHSTALHFLTPTRFRVKDDLQIDLDFETLARALLRRCSSLAEYHCGAKLDLDFRGLVERAKQIEVARRELRWQDWERYSGRQQTRMKLGGFVGEVGFVGELGEFVPLLRLGEQLHVGKGTAFGLGKYELRQQGER